MELKYGLISVDDHVQEHPEVWTQRMSQAQWGDRIPHIVPQPDGTECWMVDGVKLPMNGVASAGAAMSDRAREPQRWEEVPRVAYDPTARLQAMDVDGVDYSVLVSHRRWPGRGNVWTPHRPGPRTRLRAGV